MKRIAGLVAVVFLLLGLCACGPSTEAQWQEQYDLGVCYLSEGNYEEAIIAFTAAIEIDSSRSEAYLNLANAYLGLGDLQNALDSLRTGVESTNAPDDLTQLLRELEMRNEIQWHTDLTSEETKTMEALMSAFGQDDFESIQTSVRSTELWELILAHGANSISNSRYELDYGNTIDGRGIYISASMSNEHERSIECYYGDWNLGALEGAGIVCRYWLPPESSEWAGTEDWTITHATFSDGLANGYCERVQYHPIGTLKPDGSLEIKDEIETVSGTTSQGFWHGDVLQHSVGPDYDFRIEGTFENGIVVAVDEDYYGVNYGFDPSTGKSTDHGPDDCHYDDFMGYWDVTDPITGTGTTIEDPSSIKTTHADIWKIESLSLKNNYALVFDYMSQFHDPEI